MWGGGQEVIKHFAVVLSVQLPQAQELWFTNTRVADILKSEREPN